MQKPQIDMKAIDPKFDWRTLSPVERLTTNIIPDRLSVEPASEFYCSIFIRRVGVKMDGTEQSRVIEYCMSEGWVRQHRVPNGRVGVSRLGKVVAFKRTGKVRAYFQGELRPTGDGTFLRHGNDGSVINVGKITIMASEATPATPDAPA